MAAYLRRTFILLGMAGIWIKRRLLGYSLRLLAHYSITASLQRRLKAEVVAQMY
jgi:hypothetical protein